MNLHGCFDESVTSIGDVTVRHTAWDCRLPLERSVIGQGEMTPSELPDSQETSPLLTYDDRIHFASNTENAGISVVDGAALRRNG